VLVCSIDIETLQILLGVMTGDWSLNCNFVSIIFVKANVAVEEDMVELPVKLWNSGYYCLQVRWIPMGKLLLKLEVVEFI